MGEKKILLSNLTFSKDKDRDEIIKKHISMILTKLFDNIDRKKIISIILNGSICRGEAKVVINDNKITVYSDYDLLIVFSYVDYLLLRKKIMKLSNLFTRMLEDKGFNSHVCLVPTYKKHLRSFPPWINTYTMKNNDLVIYGDNLIRIIPDYSKKEILKSDSIEMLFNRMFEQLLSIKDIGKNGYQNIKNILDCASAVLAYNGEYEISYIKKARIFNEKYSKEYGIEDIKRWADLKVNNKAITKGSQDDWNKARDYLIKVFEDLFRKEYINETNYIKHYSGKLLFLNFLIRRPLLYVLKFGAHPKLFLNLAVYHLLRYTKDKNQDSLKKAKIYLKSNKNDFDSLKKEAINLWDLTQSSVKVVK